MRKHFIIGTEFIVSKGGATILLMQTSDLLEYVHHQMKNLPIRADVSKILKGLSKKIVNSPLYLILQLPGATYVFVLFLTYSSGLLIVIS